MKSNVEEDQEEEDTERGGGEGGNEEDGGGGIRRMSERSTQDARTSFIRKGPCKMQI